MTKLRIGLGALLPVAVSALLGASALAQRADMSDPTTGARWIAQRVRSARLGHAELVEVPLVQTSDGTCGCPPTSIGGGVDDEGAGWVSVRLAEGVTLPPVGSAGRVSRVEGYFSGNVSHMNEGTRFRLDELVVTRLVRREAGESVGARVVRSDAFVCTQSVHDDTPLNVRERPAAAAPVVSTLTDGTGVTVAEVRPDWLRVTAPATGWVYAENVLSSCTATVVP